jgi:hypothetical protein
METGDLAVSGNAGVNVYKNARGTPAIYRNSGFEFYYYCGYDSKGNLFVDGYNQPGSGHTVLGELAHGSNTLQIISLDQTIQWPGEVQWVGKRLTVEDDGGVSGANHTIYAFAIKEGRGQEVMATPLNKSGVIGQSWIQGMVVLVPGHCWPKSCYGSRVQLYKYPNGGNAFSTITKNVEAPLGLAISIASP